MKRILKKSDLARELAKKTGFYIKNMELVLNALDEVILENMKQAKVDAPSKLYLAQGFYIEGRRKKESEAVDPRNQEKILSPEKVVPKATFSQHFRNKLFSEPHGYEKTRRNRLYESHRKAKREQQENGGDE